MSPRPHHPRPHRTATTEPAAAAAPARRPDLSPLLDTVTELAMSVVDGRIAYINGPGLALLGYEADRELVSHGLDTVLDPRTLHALLLRRQGAGHAEKRDWVRAPLKRRDGTTVDSELRVAVRTGSDTLMIVARRADVTSVLGADTPAAAIHAAEGLKNLIANMAHELRTPLNAIIGFSEIIAERMFGDLNDRYAAYAGDIMASGQHLLRIINDILDYAKVEAGEMTLRPERISLNDLIRQSLRLVAAQAEQAGIEIVDELGDLSTPLHMDATKVKQILINLLSNSIKFTPRGGQVRVGSKLLTADKVEIRVADTGIGMTEAEMAEAVLPFRQPRRPPDGSYTGTGLGLPIAKALVTLHGGEMQMSSKPKVGTQVRFTLQAQAPGTPAGMLLGK